MRRAGAAAVAFSLVPLLGGCMGGGHSSRHAALVPGGGTVSVVPSSVDVRPTVPPAGGADAAAIVAARNEFESFQVVVQAGGSQLSNLDVPLSGDPPGPEEPLPRKEQGARPSLPFAQRGVTADLAAGRASDEGASCNRASVRVCRRSRGAPEGDVRPRGAADERGR